MKRIIFLLPLFCLSLIAVAQDAEGDAPDYKMVEHVYLSVAAENAEAFEEAVKKHNDMYHKGKHTAGLYRVLTGKHTGTYVWSMGYLTYTDLDSRPSDDAHDTDWENNVGKYIESTKGVEYWRMNDKMSHMVEGGEPAMIQIWWLDLTRGEGYRFRNFMQNIKTIHEEKNESISVWYNQFNEGDGRDAAIVWPRANWAEFDENDWSMSEAYDAKHGEGSWDDAMEEWEESVEKVKSTLWQKID